MPGFVSFTVLAGQCGAKFDRHEKDLRVGLLLMGFCRQMGRSKPVVLQVGGLILI